MYLEKIITYLLPANSISFVLGNLRWYFLYWELKVNDFHLQFWEPNKLSYDLQKLPLVLPREKRRRARDCIIVRKAKKKTFLAQLPCVCEAKNCFADKKTTEIYP